MMIYRSKISGFKSVMIKGAYLFGMKPKKIARKFNVSLASVYRHIK
jgi:transposase